MNFKDFPTHPLYLTHTTFHCIPLYRTPGLLFTSVTDDIPKQFSPLLNSLQSSEVFPSYDSSSQSIHLPLRHHSIIPLRSRQPMVFIYDSCPLYK